MLGVVGALCGRERDWLYHSDVSQGDPLFLLPVALGLVPVVADQGSPGQLKPTLSVAGKREQGPDLGPLAAPPL